MKPDTFDFKPSPSYCYSFILSIILSFSSFAYKYSLKKFQFEKVLWDKKNEISRILIDLSVWFIQILFFGIKRTKYHAS